MDENKTKESKTEVISPEGVEEQLITEFGFRITHTLGGKFRAYVKFSEKGQWESVGITDTKKEAEKTMGTHMALTGHMMADPVKTMEKVIEGMVNKLKP